MQSTHRSRSLSLTSRRIRLAVFYALKDTFDIHDPLSRFLPALAFRQLQAATGFLIAGDFAYRVLNEGPGTTSMEMEICAHAYDACMIAVFLVEHGYSFRQVPSTGIRDSIQQEMMRRMSNGTDRVICGVWYFRRRDVNGLETKIFLTAARESPLLCVLASPLSKRVVFMLFHAEFHADAARYSPCDELPHLGCGILVVPGHDVPVQTFRTARRAP